MLQASQAVPNLLGVSIAGYINMGWGGKVSFQLKVIKCEIWQFFLLNWQFSQKSPKVVKIRPKGPKVTKHTVNCYPTECRVVCSEVSSL